jgi:hypothetical protein
MTRHRVQSLHREGPPDGACGDADLDGRRDEGLLTDPSELRQWVLLTRGELARAPEHARNRLSIEEPLSHRRSA